MLSVLSASRARVIAITKRFSTAAFDSAAPPTAPQSYAGAVKLMHWTMGGAVLGCFAFVNLAQNTVDKKLKMQYMFYHKSCGTLAAALLMPRLLLRVASPSPGSMSSVMWEKVAAGVSHAAMYGFLIAMPVTGVAMGYLGGNGLPFFFTTIPGATKENKNGKLAGQAFKWHKYLGWYMEMLFLGHLGGVAYHVLRGEAVLARILPLSAKNVAKKA